MEHRTSWILDNTFMYRILSLALLCTLMTEPKPVYDEGSVEEPLRFPFLNHVSTVTLTICSIFLVFSLHYCHGIYIFTLRYHYWHYTNIPNWNINTTKDTPNSSVCLPQMVMFFTLQIVNQNSYLWTKFNHYNQE